MVSRGFSLRARRVLCEEGAVIDTRVSRSGAEIRIPRSSGDYREPDKRRFIRNSSLESDSIPRVHRGRRKTAAGTLALIKHSYVSDGMKKVFGRAINCRFVKIALPRGRYLRVKKLSIYVRKRAKERERERERATKQRSSSPTRVSYCERARESNRATNIESNRTTSLDQSSDEARSKGPNSPRLAGSGFQRTMQWTQYSRLH